MFRVTWFVAEQPAWPRSQLVSLVITVIDLAVLKRQTTTPNAIGKLQPKQLKTRYPLVEFGTEPSAKPLPIGVAGRGIVGQGVELLFDLLEAVSQTLSKDHERQPP